MKPKYKITAFSRLLIFVVLFTPLAYIGASYYNGEDGIAKIKALFEPAENQSIKSQIEVRKEKIEQLNAQIQQLELEIDQLNQECQRSKIRMS